jgi:hypothetical protein
MPAACVAIETSVRQAWAEPKDQPSSPGRRARCVAVSAVRSLCQRRPGGEGAGGSPCVPRAAPFQATGAPLTALRPNANARGSPSGWAFAGRQQGFEPEHRLPLGCSPRAGQTEHSDDSKLLNPARLLFLHLPRGCRPLKLIASIWRANEGITLEPAAPKRRIRSAATAAMCPGWSLNQTLLSHLPRLELRTIWSQRNSEKRPGVSCKQGSDLGGGFKCKPKVHPLRKPSVDFVLSTGYTPLEICCNALGTPSSSTPGPGTVRHLRLLRLLPRPIIALFLTLSPFLPGAWRVPPLIPGPVRRVGGKKRGGKRVIPRHHNLNVLRHLFRGNSSPDVEGTAEQIPRGRDRSGRDRQKASRLRFFSEETTNDGATYASTNLLKYAHHTKIITCHPN